MLTRRQQLAKRALDLAIAGSAVVALALPMALIGAAVRLSSPGPALFRQTRVGRHGRLFRVAKFRTMSAAGEAGTCVTVKGDSRITRLGAHLRRWKLDELPQLLNVLSGDMSLVGPRPDVPGYADRLAGEDRQILELRPGVTGPATLLFRNEEALLASAPDPVAYNDQVIYPRKVRANIEYLRAWSVTRDLRLILVTVAPALNRWLRAVPPSVQPPDPGSSLT